MLQSPTHRTLGRAARAGVAALLLAGGLGAYQGVAGRTVAHAYATGSPKPDFRGADLGNSGDEAVAGPATTPTQVFNANPGAGNGVTQGIEFDGAGNVLFVKGDGFVYSYTPLSTQNWVFTTTSTLGNDLTGAAPNPVASSDGNVYINDDAGHFYKINAATGAGAQFLNYGAKTAQTLKLDDGTSKFFFGGQDHFINSYTTAGASVYSTQAPGTTQDATISGCTGATTGNATFYGQGALDANDNFFIASDEAKLSGGGRSCSQTTFGSLYKVGPDGTILAKQPLAGPVAAAVVLTGNEVVVATKNGYVEAFDAGTLNRLFVVRAANAQINASPVVDAARNRIYVADSATSLYALNLTTGALDTTFNGTGKFALNGGTQSSPILDAAGNLYVEESTGILYSLDPTGATRYSFNTGIGTGFFSVAIGSNGTIYAGGNVGQVSGFNAVAANTATNTAVPNTATNTPKPTNTNTAVPNTATNTPVPATSTNTATNTAVPATSTNTPAPTSTPTKTPVCGQFYDVPIYKKVRQGDYQGIGFQTPIGSQVETEIVTTSTYPMQATLIVPTDNNGDVSYTTLTGTPVHNDGDQAGTNNAYKYTFNVGPYQGNGYALLVFQVPNNAPIETVLVPAEDHEPSGCEQEFDGSKTPTFQVIPGDQQDENYSGGDQSDQEMNQDSDNGGSQPHAGASGLHPFLALSRASHTVTLRHGARAANIHLVRTTGKVRMQFSVRAHGHQRSLMVTFH